MATGPSASGAAGPGMVQWHTIEFDLLTPGYPAVLSPSDGRIPTQQNGQPFDTCSIQSMTIPPGTSFGTGVITVTKSNDPATVGSAVTGGTISSETLTELTGSNWFKAGFLQFRVSATAAATVKVRLIVRMARLGFSV